MVFPGIPAGNARSAALGGSTQAPVASSPDPRGWPSNRHFSTRQVAVPADTRLHDALTVVVTLQAPRCVVGSQLAMHALLILRAYHVAGRPTPSPKPKPMGGFEGWSDMVRRAVHWASGCDPCATKAEAKSTDKTASQLPGLIEGWARLCRSAGADSLSVAQALKLLENHPSEHELLYALLTESTRDGRLPTPNSLGNLLGKIRGRTHSGRSLERIESYGVNRWFVKT